jgi:K+-sensing histidine kinase KdpD
MSSITTKPIWVRAAVGLALLFLVGWLDYLTGTELHFSPFYFIPVAVVAWSMGRRAAIAMSVACGIMWHVMDAVSGYVYNSPSIAYWNACILFFSFLVIAFTVSKIRQDLDRQRKLNHELESALGKVQRLEGLLPICAGCKCIRNDKGYWQEIEGYLTEHSDAHFSHGICPECAKKLYPEYAEKEKL